MATCSVGVSRGVIRSDLESPGFCKPVRNSSGSLSCWCYSIDGSQKQLSGNDKSSRRWSVSLHASMISAHRMTNQRVGRKGVLECIIGIPTRLEFVRETVLNMSIKVTGVVYNRLSRVVALRSARRFRVVALRGAHRLPSAKWQSTPKSKSDSEDSWILNNAGALRSMPLFAGVAGLVALLLNRTFSGIALVADASSSQSRADVLVIALCATVALTGLVWKSIEPKPQFPVALNGIKCMRLASGLPREVAEELNWTWDTLSRVSNTVSLVVVYRKTCIFQVGLAAENSDGGDGMLVDVASLLQGSLYTAVQISRKQMYLANLALYPGRFELPFLPANTQAVILQPLGDDGVMILGSDTLRGLDPNDQTWIIAIGEKLDSTLSNVVLPLAGEVAPITG